MCEPDKEITSAGHSGRCARVYINNIYIYIYIYIYCEHVECLAQSAQICVCSCVCVRARTHTHSDTVRVPVCIWVPWVRCGCVLELPFLF